MWCFLNVIFCAKNIVFFLQTEPKKVLCGIFRMKSGNIKKNQPYRRRKKDIF